MSEDGFPDPYDEPSMELIIETLTGTTFEMRVYPTDYVLDIKNKIQRIEGIPVHHQNLLYQMKELQDHARLADVGIGNGSTLKLVLAMRGGPISTRRLNTCDHHIIWKDLKELIEHTRDDLAGDRGSKVSVLVFKEGEVLNMIRVIENEDGSYSPYTEKVISPPQTQHETHAGGGPGKHREDLRQTFKKMTEDMEMATKLHALKTRMRRVRQMRHTKEATDVSAAMGQSKSAAKGAGDDLELELGEIALKEKHRSRHRERSKYFRVIEPYWGESEEELMRQDRVELECIGLELQDQPEDVAAGGVEENAIGYSTTQCKVGLLKRTTSLDYDADFGLGLVLEPSGSDVEPDDIFYRLPSLPRFATATAASSSSATGTATAPAQPKCDLYSLDSRENLGGTSGRSPLYGRRSRNEENAAIFSSPLQQHLSSSSIERLHNDFAELDYEDLDSQDLFDYYNADFRKLNEEANLANEIKKLTLKAEFVEQSSANSCSGQKTLGVNVGDSFCSASSSTSSSSSTSVTSSTLSGGGNFMGNGSSSSGGGSGGGPLGRDLPAVVTKKRMRCGQCNKRLNITNIYNCRCGRMFCSQHRYSESHDCQYDYKSEGRKLLEQQNPLVTASKLTKF